MGQSQDQDFKERIVGRFCEEKVIRVRFGDADQLAPAEDEPPEVFEQRVLAELNRPPPRREHPLFWETRILWRGKR